MEYHAWVELGWGYWHFTLPFLEGLVWGDEKDNHSLWLMQQPEHLIRSTVLTQGSEPLVAAPNAKSSTLLRSPGIFQAQLPVLEQMGSQFKTVKV